MDRVNQLEETNQQVRDEFARLKGQKPRPDIKPSLLEAASPKPERLEGSKRPGSAKRPKTAELRIDHEVQLHPENLPVGATFRCFESYVVQELIIKNENTRFLRARYDLPDGGSVLAPFPAGVLPVEGGHFGASLIAHIMDQYHQAQVTEPLLLEQLFAGIAREPARLCDQRVHPGLLGPTETGGVTGGPTDSRTAGVQR